MVMTDVVCVRKKPVEIRVIRAPLYLKKVPNVFKLFFPN